MRKTRNTKITGAAEADVTVAAKDASCTVEATDADVATVRPGLFSNFEFNANSPAIEREPEQTENGSSDAAADEPMVDAGGSPSRDEVRAVVPNVFYQGAEFELEQGKKTSSRNKYEQPQASNEEDQK
ncbi:hypothetical protein CYMTET_53653 [Cymbomonas tetramitiformis]|uniref:Uncharacterized protein n=1 Tax=Cymbomonas tetramitiformis TaxID=36881 RepID=A0AAE0BHP4_9CHLO|nr:hypothetical protein CYMTET_53653 [Cymbomonas tetramitiformis]